MASAPSAATASAPSAAAIHQQLADKVIAQDHPCVMAQTVFKTENVVVETFEDFGSLAAAKKLLVHLKQYIEHYDTGSNKFYTFMAVFPSEEPLTGLEFEKKLWQQLQAIHRLDTEAWDPEVSSNPADKDFSFSIAGKAFYMVGMHPNSSRKARQFPYPCIAFNLHLQFEKLRQMGVYQKVRDRIRKRDIALQGHMNPMLKDFGTTSEAKQYSGRQVGNEWKCPFFHK
jgi:FPC/CPF motif-containing protein YcgG